MPNAECALGITEGTVRDIAVISRVNKPVCFRITSFYDDENGERTAVLSRRAVQEACRREYVACLSVGDVIDAVVTRNEAFGTFCDIGAGLTALLPIDGISVSRLPRPRVWFGGGARIRGVGGRGDGMGRITLSDKGVLGAWEENGDRFSGGETGPGIVRSVESYGIFVGLTPNLAGLAELTPGVQAGEGASVYIKSISPDRMKIKLILVDHFPAPEAPQHISYPDTQHIDRWVYSPPGCLKTVESVFTQAEA